MTPDLFITLQKITGSLTHLAKSPENARRRHPFEVNDNEDVLGLVSGEYLFDVHKIIESKALRRLGLKTQVFTNHNNSHVRNRLVHTLEVDSIATTIAKILGLNVDLTHAIAMGHDIGHTPFGHIGEKFLAQITGKNFRHEIFACVIAQQIERQGFGLNLTHDTLLGILNHSRGKGALVLSGVSEEANIVMMSDKIAYVFSDISDTFGRNNSIAEDYKHIQEKANWFGSSHRKRTNRCLAEICIESAAAGQVVFCTSEAAQRFAALKRNMYDLYAGMNREVKLMNMLGIVYQRLARVLPEVDTTILVALMSDPDIISLTQISENNLMSVVEPLAVSEIIPTIKSRPIDFTNPDLNW